MISKNFRKFAVGLLFLAAGLFLFHGCKGKTEPEKSVGQEGNAKSAKESLFETDKAFSELSVGKGVVAAFDSFMAENATILRNHANPYVGREAIHNLQSQDSDNGTLQWQPYFADVAVSEDIGYTLGKWQYTLADSTGTPQSSSGFYVTIWKKQPDGRWKYVFDSGVAGPPPAENK